MTTIGYSTIKNGEILILKENILQHNFTTLNARQDLATHKPANQSTLHQRTAYSVFERIACSLEALVAGQKMSSKSAEKPQLMSYEEAEEATGLRRTKLESMCQNGRFREGRHYIKEGGRVLFHYNLPDLMFEDKLLTDAGNNKNTDFQAPEWAPAKKPRHKSVQSGCRMNFDY